MKREKPQNNCIPLEDIVYAPLDAIFKANIKLSNGIENLLDSAGDLHNDEAGNQVVVLKTIRMVYEQLRRDENDINVCENIGLDIPLLSIMPISALKVSKSKVIFNAEIKEVFMDDDVPRIMTQAGGRKREQRNDIQFEIELESGTVSEGLSRFVDLLNSNTVPKRLTRNPLDENGARLSGEDLKRHEDMDKLVRRERRITKNLAQTEELIRLKNNEFKLEFGEMQSDYNADPKPPLYTEIEDLKTSRNESNQRLNEIRQRILALQATEGGANESE